MESLKRILVPVDFSTCSRKALDYALDLGAALGAEVEVLHVCETPAMVSPDLMVTVPDQPRQTITQWVTQEAEKGLSALLGEVRREGGPPTAHRIVVGRTAEEISTAAERADLVVMGTHGRRGLSHLVLGSVAEKVVRTSPRPVLTLRAADE
jgi:nucleotide-binding universal stress UspA family protein